MKRLTIFFYFIFAVSQAQQSEKVDFISLDAGLSFNTETRKIKGDVRYTFQVINPVDTINIDAQRMDITGVTINKKAVKFKNTGKKLQLFQGYKKGLNTLELHYETQPRQTLYFVGLNDDFQIWTQGQGKYTSHWLPSFDDVNEKMIFSLSVTFDKAFEVLANGVLKNKENRGDLITWHYAMEKPMSSYLAMLAIGKFEKKTVVTNSGTPLEMYIRKADSLKFEPTYRYSKEIFDFFEREIGVPYPWQVYRQVPVIDFLYAGMENTTATVFSQDSVVDVIGFNDRTYVNVNAHELAHQWFGDMITAQSGKHHWLQEGFATYYALLAEKQLFGDDYFNWELYESAERLIRVSQTDKIPLLNEKASSLTFYQKGAWALHYLRVQVGETAFRKAVQNYLRKYAFKNVNTDDFLAEIRAASGYDTTDFKALWLENAVFPTEQALAIVKQNPFIKKYLDVVGLQDKLLADKKVQLEQVLKSEVFYPAKEEVIYQLENTPFEQNEPLLKLAMQSTDLKVRQAVAKSLRTIPQSFKKQYETLLDDSSYITQEIALKALWAQFPDGRFPLLDKTKNRQGFNDKNLRISWLTLALATPDYQNAEKLKWYEELLDYASPKYESSTRQNALVNLLYLNKSDLNTLRWLVNGTIHHKWQFVKFSKDTIRALLKNEKLRQYFQEILPGLPENEKIQLDKLLKE
ncbi:M1 family metallopeptidase [Flavobacterium cerinum]|uniref:Aminopeptidase N n=1 Tax=Flavobacterium cerinum TaxID=2502784 RepID=A0ABY5IPT3_9FLAO|nr:M1 family metallopeptidase [Flavobacterium cerinum]UUC44847.1 M1 family metallopeptidase [Flavobacterium cerinum]